MCSIYPTPTTAHPAASPSFPTHPHPSPPPHPPSPLRPCRRIRFFVFARPTCLSINDPNQGRAGLQSAALATELCAHVCTSSILSPPMHADPSRAFPPQPSNPRTQPTRSASPLAPAAHHHHYRPSRAHYGSHHPAATSRPELPFPTPRPSRARPPLLPHPSPSRPSQWTDADGEPPRQSPLLPRDHVVAYTCVSNSIRGAALRCQHGRWPPATGAHRSKAQNYGSVI